MPPVIPFARKITIIWFYKNKVDDKLFGGKVPDDFVPSRSKMLEYGLEINFRIERHGEIKKCWCFSVFRDISQDTLVKLLEQGSYQVGITKINRYGNLVYRGSLYSVTAYKEVKDDGSIAIYSFGGKKRSIIQTYLHVVFYDPDETI